MERKAAVFFDSRHVICDGIERLVKFHAIDTAVIRSSDMVDVGAGGHDNVVFLCITVCHAVLFMRISAVCHLERIMC